MTDNTLPATQADLGFFSQYGNATSMSTIVGSLVKFEKGDWLLGSEGSEIEATRQFTAVMDELLIGWQKWEDKKPVATDMGKLAEGFRPSNRDALGDDDEDLWEKDDNEKPRDPWQKANILLLRTPGTNGTDDDDLFTYPTSSQGGIKAIGELCKQYVRMTKEKGPGYPIIELSFSSYKHEKYGKVKTPVLKVVGWEPKHFDVAETKKVEAPKAAAKAKGKK